MARQELSFPVPMVTGTVVLRIPVTRKGDMTCTDGKQVILCLLDLPCPDAGAAGRAPAARWPKTASNGARSALRAAAGHAIRRGAASVTADTGRRYPPLPVTERR